MIRYRKLAALSVASSLVFAGAACSGDDVADNLAEKAIEESSGGDIEIDSDDGKVTYTDEDGNESEIDVSGSGSAELPEGWPAELAPPDNVAITTASTNTINGQVTMSVFAEGEGSVEQFFEGIKTQLTDAGYDIVSESNSSTADGGYASITAEGDYDVTVGLSGGGDTTTISFAVSQPTSE